MILNFCNLYRLADSTFLARALLFLRWEYFNEQDSNTVYRFFENAFSTEIESDFCRAVNKKIRSKAISDLHTIEASLQPLFEKWKTTYPASAGALFQQTFDFINEQQLQGASIDPSAAVFYLIFGNGLDKSGKLNIQKGGTFGLEGMFKTDFYVKQFQEQEAKTLRVNKVEAIIYKLRQPIQQDLLRQKRLAALESLAAGSD